MEHLVLGLAAWQVEVRLEEHQADRLADPAELVLGNREALPKETAS